MDRHRQRARTRYRTAGALRPGAGVRPDPGPPLRGHTLSTRGQPTADGRMRPRLISGPPPSVPRQGKQIRENPPQAPACLRTASASGRPAHAGPGVAYAGVAVVRRSASGRSRRSPGAPRSTIQPLRALPRPEPTVRCRSGGPGGPPPATTLTVAARRRASRTISTTVVGGSMRPTPHSRTTGVAPPSRPTASRCSATSSAAEAPLSASSRPPIAARGKHQPASRSSGATARAVTMSAGATIRRRGPGFAPPTPVGPDALLGPGAEHRYRSGQAERRHRFRQEGDPSCQRLDQRDRKVRSSHSKHDTGQTSTRPHVYDRSADRDQLRHDGAVEQVPVPQPRRLSRADEPADHTVRGQQLRVRARQRQPVAEQALGRGGQLDRKGRDGPGRGRGRSGGSCLAPALPAVIMARFGVARRRLRCGRARSWRGRRPRTGRIQHKLAGSTPQGATDPAKLTDPARAAARHPGRISIRPRGPAARSPSEDPPRS